MTPPAVLWLALVAVEVAAVGLAWHAARTVRPNATTDARSSVRETSHSGARETGSPEASRRAAGLPAFVGERALLWLLAFALVDELVLEALHAWCFAGAPRPLAGWHRAAWHLETMFVLGWPAGLAAACVPSAPSSPAGRGRSALSAARPLGARDVLLACYLAAVAGLAIVYPIPAARLRWIFLGWEVLCVAFAWWGIARRWGAPWGPVERCLVVLVSCETMVALVGPFASDPFTRWWIARCFYLAAWGGVGVVFSRPNARGRE